MVQPRTRPAWWGTVILFLVHGIVNGTWVSRIPAVKAELHLNDAVLGLTLLNAAFGAVCTIPVTGSLISRFGSKRVTSVSSVAFCLGVSLMGIAWNALSLAVALFIFGAIAAAMDVSMNAQGVEVEKAMARPTMSRFHAMFSLGAMGGAAIGGWVAGQDIAPLTHFLLGGFASLIAVLVAIPLLLETDARPAPEEAREHRLPLRSLPGVLIALSAIGFCVLLSEGAMADWTAVYYRQTLHTGAGLAAEGYAVFSASMAVFRFIGDWVTAHLGPLRTVRTGCLVAAAGLVCTLSVHSPLLGFPGLAITGAGLSVIIPLVFGGGGRVPGINPGPGIATVTGIGYVGFIVGPPTIGFVSQMVTLRCALGIVVACCLVAAYLSRFMASLAPVTNLHTPSFPGTRIHALEPPA